LRSLNPPGFPANLLEACDGREDYIHTYGEGVLVSKW
jgi:hypothetical protein